MKHLFYISLILSGFMLSSCGQYGRLYLPDAKKDAPVMKVTPHKTAETPVISE